FVNGTKLVQSLRGNLRLRVFGGEVGDFHTHRPRLSPHRPGHEVPEAGVDDRRDRYEYSESYVPGQCLNITDFHLSFLPNVSEEDFGRRLFLQRYLVSSWVSSVGVGRG